MNAVREDEIGRWSEHKLDLLRRYLPAYTTIMARQTWCRGGFHYVDGFAGTGRPQVRDEDRYVKGSPRIALELATPFRSYTFVEKEPWRARRLRELIDEFPNRRVRVLEGDCNDVILDRVVPVVRREHAARGVVFLDPFGMQLRWETIEAVAGTEALELVLNFPTMAATRSALPTAIGGLADDHAARMTALWGSEDWRPRFYEPVPVPWGEVERRRGPVTAERLAGVFANDRLRSVFPHVTEPLIVSNGRGVPIYGLIFAGHNETGAKIAREVFRPPKPVPMMQPLWADAS